MRFVSKILAALAATAAFAGAPAYAAVLPCSAGGIDLTVNQCIWSPGPPGNDNLASVEAAIAAATGVAVASLNLSLYDKSDGAFDFLNYTPDSDPQGNLWTNWSVKDGTLIKYVTVKGANEFKVYELAGAGASSGLGFSTEGLLTPNGKNQPGISHLSFWTVPAAVPEPETWALMLLGFTAVGWGLRRGNSGDGHPRMRVLYDA